MVPKILISATALATTTSNFSRKKRSCPRFCPTSGYITATLNIKQIKFGATSKCSSPSLSNNKSNTS